MRKILLVWAALAFAVLACVRSQPEIIVITATFPPPTSAFSSANLTQPAAPTAFPTAVAAARTPQVREYVVRPGDTLSAIAAAHNVPLALVLQLNPQVNPDLIEVGQVIRLPEPPSEVGSAFRILPDSKVVRGPGSSQFDIRGFIATQRGAIRTATDMVGTELLTAAEIVERVSLEFSVDARLLLALLELKTSFLSDPLPTEEIRNYPLNVQPAPFGFDRRGLYRQLAYAADQINAGYYAWKAGRLDTINFADGTRLLYADSLNAGTAGVQYFLSRTTDYATWQRQVSANGLYQIYTALFGDPFANAIDPLIPTGLTQPELVLPFPQGETWFYTGGPHGGWGSGSAWAAIDFAPPDDLTTKTTACYVSDYFATAVAPGVIARTDEGVVILDLDGDGDEATGWTILYLHIAEQDRVEERTWVEVGDPIGRPSCEGGVSSGTHMHLARRYNGEWIPASCTLCTGENALPPLVLSGWRAVGIDGQEYQGFLVKGGEQRVAEQGRNIAENEVSW